MDTSILCELLKIPGRSGAMPDASSELLKRASSSSLILPSAAVIETGNHVSHIADGGYRRDRAEQFGRLLELSAQRKAPWVLNEVVWDGQYLEALRRGAETGMTLAEHAARQKLGTGDLTILLEKRLYEGDWIGLPPRWVRLRVVGMRLADG